MRCATSAPVLRCRCSAARGPLDAFLITGGGLRKFGTIRMGERGFCPECGSRITVGGDPGRNLVGILAASLDDPGLFVPAMDIFVYDAQAWDLMNSALAKYDQYPRGAGRT